MTLEENLPAKPKAALQNAWFPCADEDCRRPQHDQTKTPKGTSPLNSMKGDEPSRSFPKSLRLLRRPDYRRVYEEGRRGSARVCTIFYRSNGLTRTRLGITTPKALGGAVTRNRIRRRLREIFRLNQAVIPTGWDVVLNPRTAAANIPFPVLSREILKLFPHSAAQASAGPPRA